MSYATAKNNMIGAPSEASLVSENGTLAYNSHALAELAKRIDERVEGFRGLADFVAGTEPQDTVSNGALRPVSSGLVAEIRERIMAIETRISHLAYEYGRLERAIRG